LRGRPSGRCLKNRSTISTLAAIAPDARDYQARKPGTFEQAQAEHRDRLESVMDELEQIAEHVSDHM
jgi:hypothetical protein